MESRQCLQCRPSIAFGMFRTIRSFITFHGIFMAYGYDLGEDSIWREASFEIFKERERERERETSVKSFSFSIQYEFNHKAQCIELCTSHNLSCCCSYI